MNRRSRCRRGRSSGDVRGHSQYCNENGSPTRGSCLSFGRTPRRSLSETTDMIGRRRLMTHFPAEMKAFNMKRVLEDGTLTGSVDLARRRRDCRRVEESRRRRAYQESRRTSSTRRRLLLHGPAQERDVPSQGHGLGTERFVMWLLGEDTISNACLSPRHIDHCESSSSFSGKNTSTALS